MPEIKREPICITLPHSVDEENPLVCFDEDHTIADIARWLIEKDYDTDIIYMLIEGRKTL